MKKCFDRHGKYIWRFFCVLFIITISAIRVKAIKIPVISSGELPYWDLILRLAGREGIMDASLSSYLMTFGYCLPFSILIRNGVSLLRVYKIAVLLNGILWGVLYGIAVWICEKLTSSNLNSIKREGMMSLLCILPVFAAQASAMGPQMILAVIILLLIYYISCLRKIKSFEKKDKVILVGTGIAGILISPLFAGVLIGIIAFFYAETAGFKEYKKDWLFLIGMLCIGILLLEVMEYGLLLKLQVSSNEWNYTGLHSLFHMVAKGRRMAGLLGFVYGLIGKGMYLITNTYGLILVGLYVIVGKKREVSAFGKVTRFVVFPVVFLLLAVHRTDVNCGLPVDITLAMIAMPLLIEAAIAFFENKMRTKDIVYIGISILVIGCLSRDVWEAMKKVAVDWADTGIMGVGREFCRDVFETSILSAATVTLLFFIIWMVKQYSHAAKESVQGKIIKYYTGFFLFIMYGIMASVALISIRCYIADVIEYAQDKVRFSYEIPGEYLEKTKRPILYYDTGSSMNGITFSRLLSMNNQDVTYTQSLNKVIAQGKETILITKDLENIPEEIADAYERVYGTNQIVVWEKNGVTKKDSLKSALIGNKVKLVKVNSTDYTFVEYGKGYILPKGKYEIKIKLRVTTNKKGKLGRIAVRSESETLTSKSIDGSGTTDGKTIRLEIESTQDLANFRVAIHKNRSVDIEEEWVYITKVGDVDEKEE